MESSQQPREKGLPPMYYKDASTPPNMIKAICSFQNPKNKIHTCVFFILYKVMVYKVNNA